MKKTTLESSFSIGDGVRIDGSDIKGVVTALLWRSDEAKAEVCYFHNGEQKEVWVNVWRLSDAD